MKDSFKKDRINLYYAKTFFLFLEILKITEQHPVLIWRQRPRLNLNFQGAKVRTNSLGFRSREVKSKKDSDTFRIICLGASPTFGWGISQKEAYPFCLENFLRNNKDIKKKIEVVNAAEIGYSSCQGLNFLTKYILDLSPDLITVSYIINDVDIHRFYRNDCCSDKELNPKNKIAIFLENFFGRSNIYNYLKQIIVGKSFVLSKKGRGKDYQSQRRVSALDYRKNLERFIQIANEKKVRILFIVMPVNLPEASELSKEQKMGEDLHLNKVYQYLGKKEYKMAIDSAKEVLRFNPWSSKAFYCLNLCFEGIGNSDQAAVYFQKAKEAESRQCGKLGKVYNSIMREVAKENNIILIDIASLFDNISKTSKEYLFLDPEGDTIHPNPRGHEVIARQLFSALVEYNLVG